MVKPESVKEKDLRSFGLMVGGVFAVIGIWPSLLRNESPRSWALAVGIVLIFLGTALPMSLQHVYVVWMRIGHVLGWINTRILLGVVFYGLITPMGLVMRLFGKDSMYRTFSPQAPTYRVIPRQRPRTHMTNQF